MEALSSRSAQRSCGVPCRFSRLLTATTAPPVCKRRTHRTGWQSSVDICSSATAALAPAQQSAVHAFVKHASFVCRSAAASAAPLPDAEGAGALANVFLTAVQQIQQQQQQQQSAGSLAAQLDVAHVTFHPPGVEQPLVSDVSLTLPAGSLGLIIGRSGSGKTTLLQILAGLCQQDSGSIRLTPPAPAEQLVGVPKPGLASSGPGTAQACKPLSMEERMQQVGLVFQFPERHFLGEDIFEELTFTWPRAPQFEAERKALTARVNQVIKAVRLEDVPLSMPPVALSGGQQRRLALAIQLVRRPSLLLLDEPLAGLDWTARAEVVSLLQRLKRQCTLLVVSHDMREIAPLVDCCWRMQLGGTLQAEQWPLVDDDVAQLLDVKQ